jgi:hypothetical protein
VGSILTEGKKNRKGKKESKWIHDRNDWRVDQVFVFFCFCFSLCVAATVKVTTNRFLLYF